MNYLNIWQNIFDLLNFKSQLSLIFTNSITITNLRLVKIDTIHPEKYNDSSVFIGKDIIETDIFQHVKEMRGVIDYSADLSQLKNLKILVSINRKLEQHDIDGLDLVKLSVKQCNFNDLNFMTNLKNLKLIMGGDFSFNSINQLKLTSLSIKNSSNDRYSDITSMTTLKKLKIKSTDIHQYQIDGLDLVFFRPGHYIFDISFMKNLKVLDLTENTNIRERDMQSLNLYKLKIGSNCNFRDLSFMTTLKILHVNYFNCCVDQAGIQGLDLIELYMSDNKNITCLTHMQNLKILHAENTNIYETGLRGLKLTELVCGGTNHIRNLNFMTSLKRLNIIRSPYIEAKDIRHLDLYELHIDLASKYRISDLSFMHNLQILNGIRIRPLI